MHSETEPVVYFFNPSFEEYSVDFFNLGILSIASYLNQKRIPVGVYMDYLHNKFTVNKDYDLILPALLAKPHKYVGISCMTSQFRSGLDLTRRIKEISPGTPVVWGGHHTNIYPEYLLKSHKEIDFCVVGPGEQAAEALYYYLDRKNYDLDAIAGLVYRKNGTIKKNKKAQMEKQAYNLQFDYSLIADFRPIERYFAGELVKSVTILSSLGCPYRCRFCINSIESSALVFRNLDIVIQELKQVLENKANCIFFVDENFFIDFNRVDNFLKRMNSEGLHFSWFVHARIDSINPKQLNQERLGRIHELGCKELHFGIESGSQSMLDRINKRIKVEEIIPALKKVRENGIISKANFIFGMPQEEIADVKETIYLIMKLAEEFEGQIILMIYFFYPILGSPMTDDSFMSINVPESVKIDYCIEAVRFSGHPYKLFKHFDREGFYGWIPDKKLFAELWFIARVISDICLPYKLKKGRKQNFAEWSLGVSQETYNELVENCPKEVDRDMVIRWLKRVLNN